MERPPARILRIGDWFVNPLSGEIARGEERVRLEARTMRLLLCLAETPGEVVSIDNLLSQVWSGVVVTPDSVYQAIAALRRLLGDDAKQPTYIVTVPRLGYRLVAPVDTQVDEAPAAPRVRPRSRMYAALAIAILLGVGSLTYYLGMPRTATSGETSQTVAVLPFLDLTDDMNEEPFDGSVRKSGDTLRVAARLLRADDGYVVWSETYDRPLSDKLMVQDDIAGEVTSALRATIN